MVHDELTFEALTGFIDYYAYMMLGYDFDSFAELGGSDYFAKAQDVVDLAQSSNAIGWSSFKPPNGPQTIDGTGLPWWPI